MTSSEADPTAPWGMRGWMCGVCRTALAPGTTCGRLEWHGEPIAVRPAEGRAILAGRVYGYPPASPWRALARGNLDRAARRARRWLRNRFGRARGGMTPGRVLGPPTGRFGTIRAIDAAPPPWGGAPCAAWAIELRLLDGLPATMLRDAGCLELAIDLDDGARVRVPAGAIVIGTEVAALEEPDPAALARYLDWVGVAPAPGLRDVVPHHEIWTVRVHAGERVEVRGALLDDLQGAAYRDPTGLRPDDVVRVVVAGRR